MRRKRQRGSAAVETALVAIPMICMFLGTVELGRCMWMLHTLSNATKAATRYAIVHGEACAEASATCSATIGAVAGVIRRAGIGLDGRNLTLRFSAGSSTIDCTSLASCETSTAAWPPASHNAVGQQVSIEARYSFVSVVTSFWPGQSRRSVELTAQTTEAIQF
jgi:Flp pilus assembly protein TadG